MLHGLSLRVSWICLLLFSSGACFPAAIDDYQYPYTDVSSVGLSPRSGAPDSHRPPLQSLEPAAAQEAEIQSPSTSGATSLASPSYQPNSFVVSSESRPARAPQSSGYVSAPSFSMKPQSAASSGHFAAYSPAASAPSHSVAAYPAASSHFAAPVSYGAPSMSYGAPAASHGGFGAASYPGGAAPGGETRVVYSGAPSFGFDGPTFATEWAALPSIGFESFDPNGWMPSRSFPDFTVWGPAEEEPANPDGKGKGGKGVQDEEEEEQETFSVPSSSYIVQTRNGYQRARQVTSHMNYSPELPEPAVIYYEVIQRAEPQDEQVKGGKGKKP
ncbi:apomucin-like [Xyrichtys novacula]|uniref:Apomucin-like n=1 Tax=Xyrichtys novacula TaxID=13765 RepID=A0AAV1H5T2_XYRNO|nr:apomucin-like [Xyrichtys novacula]